MVNWIRSWWHQNVTHRFKLNTGRVVTWHDESNIYVGFQCDQCGKIDDASVDKIKKVEFLTYHKPEGTNDVKYSEE